MTDLKEVKRDFKREFFNRNYISGVGVGDNHLNVYLTESLRDEWKLPSVYCGYEIHYIVTGERKKLQF